MAESVLVVDDDPDVARFVEVEPALGGLRGARRLRRRGGRWTTPSTCGPTSSCSTS